MIGLLVGASVAFAVTILATPVAMRLFRRRGIGQFIQEEVTGHAHKQGTPTMGGVVLIAGATLGYILSHLRVWSPTTGFELAWRPLQAGGLLAIGALLGMGAIGFVDDWVKFTRARSLGLNKRAKFGGQVVVAAGFAWGAARAGLPSEISFTRSLGLSLGALFFVWVLLLLTGSANAVNLADGMDGLASGSAALVFAAYVIIAFWQFRHPEFYDAIDPLELGIVAAAMLGATLGFLWWNAPPADIFMGDVGSQALGGVMAALALLTETQLLLAIIGGIYVAITLSVIIQVASFRLFGRRVFRMAPLHHHFELLGWPETKIVVRFWILAGIGVALGLGIFYGDFIASGGVG